MKKENRFQVECCAKIDDHIGKAVAYCVGDSPSDWYIESVENEFNGYLSGEFVDDRLYEEIAEEVAIYFGVGNENEIELLKEEGKLK